MAPDVGRLHGRRTFRALSRPDGRGSCGPVSASFCVQSQPTGRDAVRVGYAIGKAHGNAVARNRLRRRLRAAVAAAPAFVPGDYLIRASAGAAALPFAQMVDAVAGAAGTAAGSARGSGPAKRPGGPGGR